MCINISLKPLSINNSAGILFFWEQPQTSFNMTQLEVTKLWKYLHKSSSERAKRMCFIYIWLKSTAWTALLSTVYKSGNYLWSCTEYTSVIPLPNKQPEKPCIFHNQKASSIFQWQWQLKDVHAACYWYFSYLHATPNTKPLHRARLDEKKEPSN